MNNTVSYGDVGTDVKRMQASLKKAGFYKGNLDGLFGPATKTALGNFQKSKGLTVDYKCGPKTWGKIKPYLDQAVGELVVRVVEQVDGLDDFKTLSGLLED